MANINLGPYITNKPSLDEKINIRESLGLNSASLLDAEFNDVGSVLTISDPSNNKSIVLDTFKLSQSVASQLEFARSFNVSGDVTTPNPPVFNGTQSVTIDVVINENVIDSDNLKTDCVIATKIKDQTITPYKLSIGAPAWTETSFYTTNQTTIIGDSSSGPISIKIGSNRSGSGDSILEFKSSTSTTTRYNSIISRGSGNDGVFTIENTGLGTYNIRQLSSSPIILSTNNIERMRIAGGGNITISSSLDVSGTVKATTFDGGLTNNSIITNNALELVNNKLQIKNEGITADMMGTNSVDTESIVGNSVTQGKIAQNVVGTGPVFKAYTTSPTVISTASPTKVSLNAVDFDTNGFVSGSQNIVASIGGYYLITASVSTTNAAAGLAALIYKNGNLETTGNVINGDSTVSNCSAVVRLEVGNIIELYCQHSSSGNRTINISKTSTFLSGYLIRPL